MATVRIIRMAPEYGCWPLWDDATGENIEPTDLPIPPELAQRIGTWDDIFQTTLDRDDPVNSAFPDPSAEAAWRDELDAIFDTLGDVLGAENLRRRS